MLSVNKAFNVNQSIQFLMYDQKLTNSQFSPTHVTTKRLRKN